MLGVFQQQFATCILSDLGQSIDSLIDPSPSTIKRQKETTCTWLTN